VLGFNLGIEVMQVFVILITIPWFIIMGRTCYFKPVTTLLSILIGMTAIGLIVQRVTGMNNIFSMATDQLAVFSPWLIGGLCLMSVMLFGLTKIPDRQVAA